MCESPRVIASPMEFLVLPRVLALILMMPLLTIYADLVGILGGAVVGVGMLGLGPTEYFAGRSAAAVGLATTSAVVTSIVLIIVVDGIFAVILDVFHL